MVAAKMLKHKDQILPSGFPRAAGGKPTIKGAEKGKLCPGGTLREDHALGALWKEGREAVLD